MWRKYFVAVCLVATVVFTFTGPSEAAPTKGCKKSITSLSQEAGLEAQALTDPDEDKVYHGNSLDDIAFMKKKSKVQDKRSDDEDDCEVEGAENGSKKENIVHQEVQPIPKSDIIKLDINKPAKFVESIQIDADDNNDTKVKKSSPSLISPLVEEQKQKIQTLQASIHKNLAKLFHHLKHSHPQNSLADQQEVAQAKEALIADAKRMTALNHDPSPAENFLSGLSNNTLISKMLKNKSKSNVVLSLDKTPGNATGVNTSSSAANAKVKDDSSFQVKINEGGKPDSHEGSSNVEVKTSGDVKSSGNGSTNVEIKNDGQSSFHAEGGNKASTSQGSSGTEIKSGDLDSIDLAMKSSNDQPKENGNKVKNNSKVTPSDNSSSSNSNKTTVKLGKFSLGKKEESVTKIKVKEVKEKESDEKPNINHDPYAEIAASPDDPKMPPNIKLPKEGPYIPVGMPKDGNDDDDDDEPSRDNGKEREKDRGRGEGGGGGQAPFIPPPGDFEGQSEAPGQNDLSMAGNVNPDLADKGILNSFRTEAIQAQLQDQIQQQALEGQMMQGMNGMMGRGRMASSFGGGLDGLGAMGGMGGMHGMGGMGMGAIGGMGAMGGMAGMAGAAGMGAGTEGPRMAAMGRMGGMNDMQGGMGGMAGGIPGGMGAMGGMEGVGGMGAMGFARSMDGYGGMGRMPEMVGDMESDERAYGRRGEMPEEQLPYGGQYGYDEGPRYPSMMEERGVSRNIVPARYTEDIRRQIPMYNPRYFNDVDDDDDDDGPDGDDSNAVAATQRDRAPEPRRYEDLQGNDDEPDEDYDSEDERKTKIAKVGKLSKTKTKSVKRKVH